VTVFGQPLYLSRKVVIGDGDADEVGPYLRYLGALGHLATPGGGLPQLVWRIVVGHARFYPPHTRA
jgi:hypothetical protein